VAGEGLRRECGLLQRIDSAGVERCLGVGAAGPGVTVEVLSPYLVNDRQLDRWAGDWKEGRVLVGIEGWDGDRVRRGRMSW
jgi:hypothetical protein